MHFKFILPLTCLLSTLTSAIPIASPNPNTLITLDQRTAEPVPVPDRKGHFGGTGTGKRDAEAEPISKGHFGGTGTGKRDAEAEPIGKGHLESSGS